jgi:diguanylate cyclase (GGDEF)-like protein
LLIYNLLYYFRKDMQPDLVVRQSNRLPEKDNLQLIYKTLLAEHKSLSIMLVSVDKLSEIVDAHGRNAGDDILDKVVSYLAENMREQDVVGRWSSAEFIILLPHTGPHVAFDIAQNLRHGIATLPPLQDLPEVVITASIGISYTASTRAMHEVTAHAEDALYQAKRDGSNLVRMQLID